MIARQPNSQCSYFRPPKMHSNRPNCLNLKYSLGSLMSSFSIRFQTRLSRKFEQNLLRNHTNHYTHPWYLQRSYDLSLLHVRAHCGHGALQQAILPSNKILAACAMVKWFWVIFSSKTEVETRYFCSAVCAKWCTSWVLHFYEMMRHNFDSNMRRCFLIMVSLFFWQKVHRGA